MAACASAHTKRSYRHAWQSFAAYMRETWSSHELQARPKHVQAWRSHMQALDLAPATISQRMASVSSLYQFVIGQAPHLLRGADNPFQETARPRQDKFSAARPMNHQVVGSLLGRINRDTLTGARDYALLTTFFFTGWHTGEVLGMRCSDLTLSPDGSCTCLWRGRGKTESVILPACIGQAIGAYLALANRCMDANEYLWLPLSLQGCANFANACPDAGRPISGAQANNILRKRLRLAGVSDPDSYHIGRVRDTFAWVLGQSHDHTQLSHKLHHADVGTTGSYLKALNDAYGAGSFSSA